MNPALPFIPKDDEELPDSYGVTICFHDGKNKELELVSHILQTSLQLFEVVTREDKFIWFPLSGIRYIEFDKRFSKIVAIKEKHTRNANEKV